MRNAELSHLIRNTWPDFELRFNLVSSSYSTLAFGDSEAAYSDSEIEIRFSRDRGEVACDLRLHGSEKWASLSEMYTSVGSSHRPEAELQFLKNCMELLVNDYELVILSLKGK